jgi:group I intron endonuclease
MITGIYQIRNLMNGKLYIGSAAGLQGFAGRWRVHKHRLNKNQHHSLILQNAWNKYGESFFTFEILFYCDPKDCLVYEQIALDSIKPRYNICKIAGSQLGQKRSLESRRKMSIAQSGSKHRNYGKSLPRVTREKISLANMGHAVTDDTRKKIARSVGKLTEDQVRVIKQKLRLGVRQGEIAREFGIVQSLVSQIKSGKRWGYV